MSAMCATSGVTTPFGRSRSTLSTGVMYDKTYDVATVYLCYDYMNDSMIHCYLNIMTAISDMIVRNIVY